MTSGLSLYWEVLKIEGLTNQDSMYLGDPELITFLDFFFLQTIMETLILILRRNQAMKLMTFKVVVFVLAKTLAMY